MKNDLIWKNDWEIAKIDGRNFPDNEQDELVTSRKTSDIYCQG